MDTLILLMPLIVGAVAYKKYRFSEITFYVMYMTSVCYMGFFYNNIYRIGSIFPSDIYLVLFVFAWIIGSQGKIKVPKDKFCLLIFIVIVQFSLTIIYDYEMSEALTDFKYVLYFFVPYFYSKTIWNDKDKMKFIFWVYVAGVFVSIILNMNYFWTSGFSTSDSGETSITRTFGYGMGFACPMLLSLLLMSYRDKFVKRFNSIIYYLLQIIFIVSIILSYTRTNWISYIIMLVAYVLIIKRRQKVLTLNKVLRFCVIILLIVAIVLFAQKQFPELVNLITERFDSISDTTSDTDNTFYARINNYLASIDVFTSPRIFIGYGYGSQYYNQYGEHSNRLENSFIYYIWKYGWIFAIYLFYSVFKRLKRTWKTGNLANQTFVIYFAVAAFVASWSGNLNETYSLGIYSFVWMINYGIVFDDDSNVKIEKAKCNIGNSYNRSK